MSQIALIGLQADESRWARTLVGLLRHPDPVVVELTKQALLYLENVSARATAGKEKTSAVN